MAAAATTPYAADAGTTSSSAAQGTTSSWGPRARDLLIGGLGRDKLIGGGGDDLLVGGTTAYDDNDAALVAILAEWTVRRGLAVRIANLEGDSGSGDPANGNHFLRLGESVFDDGESDCLFGQGGDDWLLAFSDPTPGAGRKDRVKR